MVRFDELAQLDLLEAIIFYESERPGYGRKFEDEVEALVEMLEAHQGAERTWRGILPRQVPRHSS